MKGFLKFLDCLLTHRKYHMHFGANSGYICEKCGINTMPRSDTPPGVDAP